MSAIHLIMAVHRTVATLLDLSSASAMKAMLSALLGNSVTVSSLYTYSIKPKIAVKVHIYTQQLHNIFSYPGFFVHIIYYMHNIND